MQTTARPRFRQDLLAEVIEEGGQKFIDVADPDGNAIFRFFEVEYAIACGMDGQRDVPGIVKWAQDELGLSASPAEIQSVINTLAGLAFIGDDQLVDTAATKEATKAPAAQPAPAQQAKPAARGDDLAPGVVAAKQAPAPAKGLDVELGHAGTSAPVAQAKDLPVADIALGAPGAVQTKQPPKIPVEDVALGAPGASAAQAKKKADDIAMDLSSEMSVGKGDVKEAVRQSKVMTAVEVPKELLEAEAKPVAKAKAEPVPAKGEAKPEPKKPEAPKPEPKKEEPKKAEAPKPEPKKEEPKKAEAPKPEPKKEEPKKAAEPAKKPAVEKVPEKAPVAPPAPSAGVSPALIVTLIVVIVAAGAYLAYKFVFAKETAQPKTPPAAAKPPEPPPPATATAKIVLETPAPMEVKAGVAGALELIQPAGTEVKAGDTIAMLAGAKPLETQIAAIDKQIEQLKAPLTAAEEKLAEEQAKENNAAAAQAAQKRVDELKKPISAKETERKAKQEQLDKLAIKSTADGTLAPAGEVELKAGDKVTADQIVATVAAPAVATANFKVPAGVKLGGDNLEVKAGDKAVACKITDAQAESVKVACPADAGLADGAEVTVTFPK